MLGSFDQSRIPAVSIILPTFNRERFLPAALRSIDAQTFTDWELIVVDDGSVDETNRIINEHCSRRPERIRYSHQENQGAYAARNTGLDLARGRYVAFFDSDDQWLPHHLTDCVTALDANTDVDWVYGACRIVDFATGKTLDQNTFYLNGQLRPFTRLRTRKAGDLKIIDDPDSIRCMLLHGFYCGLQNSVIRRSIFAHQRFRTEYRNEAEDQLLVVRALAGGHRLGYFENVHVTYHIHGDNSSATGHDASLERNLRIYEALARGYEELRDEVILTAAEHRALNRRLSREYFWNLGYALLWQHGRRAEAVKMFRKGIRLCPWNLGYWKTYLLALARTKLAPRVNDMPPHSTLSPEAGAREQSSLSPSGSPVQ